MARPRLNRPTDAELAILAAIWAGGNSTVRQVKALLKEQGVGLAESSVLKLMQIMVGKTLLIRDDTVRPQVYSPATRPDQMQKHLVADLAKRGFGGSVSAMVIRALSDKSLTAEDRAAIRHALDAPASGEH